VPILFTFEQLVEGGISINIKTMNFFCFNEVSWFVGKLDFETFDVSKN
jgi:hypothetical protein